ncbi:hypothetical protein D9756_003552 [Leucocoprinus leucothites]|uniref:Uncharacterized protein n=1 Tax=Leucocoprinus leucothites TaxID=201217 RepID=A0A8H5G6U2_9AGAR|nr:hypothetical protein D9756_003552 [Leucoagaricus leucothites]
MQGAARRDSSSESIMPSNSDDNWDGKSSISAQTPLIAETSMAPEKQDQGRNIVRGLKRRHLLRCATFFVLEAAYIAFSAVLLKHSLPLPRYVTHFDASSIKSGLTTLSILWHTAAGVFASDILADSFSREWSVNPKSPTDRVSTITSGILDRASHLIRTKSTRTFKFTVFVSVLLFALLRLGPSTIIVSNGFEYRSVAIGYETQPNWVIPRPAYNAAQTGALEYPSDLINFRHSCQWQTPVFNSTAKQVAVGGEIFEFGGFANVSSQTNTTLGTSVSFLIQLNNNSTKSALLIFGGNSTFPLRSVDNATTSQGANRRRDPQSISSSPVSGWDNSVLNSSDTTGSDSLTTSALRNSPNSVFSSSPFFGAIGGSPGGIVFTPSSGEIPSRNTINLDGLPTSYDLTLYNFSTSRFKTPDSDNSNLVFQSPLVVALLCDAKPMLSTGRIRLASNNLTVQSYELDTGRVGNLNQGDIPAYFSTALAGINDEIIMVPSEDAGKSSYVPLIVDFGPLAAVLLLPPIDISAWVNASLPPLPLDDIGRRMDAFVLSVSKVQQVEGVGNVGDTFLTNGSQIGEVPAVVMRPDQVLSSNPVYLGLTTALALMISVASAILAILIERQGRPPFDLKHILSLLHKSTHVSEKDDSHFVL